MNYTEARSKVEEEYALKVIEHYNANEMGYFEANATLEVAVAEFLEMNAQEIRGKALKLMGMTK